MSGEQKQHAIHIDIDGEEVAVFVPAEHAEHVGRLLQKASQFEEEWDKEPETLAARLTVALESEEPGLAFARTMIVHSDTTGDREGPLQGVGAFMLSHGSMLADLAMLLRWLCRQGNLDEEAAERLGLREDALENIDRLVEELDYPAGPGDLAREMQVRAHMRQLRRKLDETDDGYITEETRLRILLLLATGMAADFDDAAQKARQ